MIAAGDRTTARVTLAAFSVLMEDVAEAASVDAIAPLRAAAEWRRRER